MAKVKMNRKRVEPPMLAADYFTSRGYPPSDDADLYRMLARLRGYVGRDATIKKGGPDRPVAVAYVQYEPSRASWRKYGRGEKPLGDYDKTPPEKNVCYAPKENVAIESLNESLFVELTELDNLANRIKVQVNKIRLLTEKLKNESPALRDAVVEFLSKVRTVEGDSKK